jgi:S-DNA-T family DNA segregation ATPase FtsK/SpoIIIE
MSTNNTTEPSMTDEIIEWATEELWAFKVEVAVLVILGGAFYEGSRYLGYWPTGVILGGLIGSILTFSQTRHAVGRLFRWSSWSRRFNKALDSQDSVIAKKRPTLIQVERFNCGVRLTLSLASGTSLEEFEKLASYLAVHFGAREVRMDRAKTNASIVVCAIYMQDPFEGKEFTWTSAKGVRQPTSAWDPIPIGIDRDGNEVKLSLIERNLLIGGEPGSGKSVALNVVIANLAQCSDVAVHLFDAKSVELEAWTQIAAGFVGPNIDDAIAQLRRLRSMMEDRYRFLGQQRARKLHRKHRLNLIVVVIDELPFYVANPDRSKAREFGDILGDLIARGRAAGIIFVVAAQKPSADTLPSAIRDLINLRLAFRCSTKEASDTILGGGWASAGFSAATIGINNRGVGWLLGESGQPELIRVYLIDDVTIAQIVEENSSRFRDKEGEDQWN